MPNIKYDYLSLVPTWCNNSGHGCTFQMVLGGDHADVVLHARVQALQHDGGLISSDKLFQGVSSLAVAWCACHSVACDACRKRFFFYNL